MRCPVRSFDSALCYLIYVGLKSLAGLMYVLPRVCLPRALKGGSVAAKKTSKSKGGKKRDAGS